MGMQALSETVRKERKELAEAAKQQEEGADKSESKDEEGADKSESKDSKGAGQEPRRSKRGAGTKPAAARKDAAKACADPAAANKKCEDCQLKVPSFGLPAEGKKRWCSGCAKAHAEAVDICNKNRAEGTTPPPGSSKAAKATRAAKPAKADDAAMTAKADKKHSSNEAKWEAQLARLVAYEAAHGDCSVPQRWVEDPKLAMWVLHQRQGKRKLDRSEPSGMTAERAARLTSLGFVWKPRTKAAKTPDYPATDDPAVLAKRERARARSEVLCHDCGLRKAGFKAAEGDGPARWCSGCSKQHAARGVAVLRELRHPCCKCKRKIPSFGPPGASRPLWCLVSMHGRHPRACATLACFGVKAMVDLAIFPRQPLSAPFLF